MKIIQIGDVYGSTGRKAVAQHLPLLIKTYSPDFISANVDNAAHGSGITAKILRELEGYGIDFFFGGDHCVRRSGHEEVLNMHRNIIRPANYAPSVAGRGSSLFITTGGQKILAIHLAGQVFMESYNSPFGVIEQILDHHKLGDSTDAIIVDFHAEATSEKVAMGRILDGRVSAVLGTHTHIPTADAMILPNKTGYITDIGMTGDYNSVIGADKAVPLEKFSTGIKKGRFEPAEGEGTLCAMVITLDDKTGLTQKIEPIRIGGFWDKMIYHTR